MEEVHLIKKVKLNIWGREFNLPVEYDCYTGEKVTKNQINSVEKFCNDDELLNMAKHEIEKYCKNDVANDDENQNKDNIFSYIMPHYLFIKREENPRIALMCNYRYDLEHGLAIIFDGKKIKVGIQDIIL